MTFLGGLRSVAAVIAGYAVFAISAFLMFRLSARDPHAAQPLWFQIVSVMGGVIGAFAGGWIAAAIAPFQARIHAAIVAVILAAGATVSLLMSPGKGAIWTQVSAILLMAPAAFLGGTGWEKRQRGNLKTDGDSRR